MAHDDGIDEAAVRAALTAAGLDPPADEIPALARSYAAMRAAADSLYLPRAAEYLPAMVPAPFPEPVAEGGAVRPGREAAESGNHAR